ncbi:MAG TPA: GNAT family protein [Bacteroidia bacterium]|jgi:ribosomal-protein-alanine N-acetyltransferase|nr:GNAT family protein [Bacteroidia bacterium]
MINLNFNPFPNLATERVVLRQMTKEDAADVLLLRADESVSKYIARNPYTTIEEVYSFIDKITTGITNNECGYWAIALKETNRLIGTSCIWHINIENMRAEIGYELHPAYQKKGIMQEALPVLIKYAFGTMKLHSLEADVYPENAASIKLLEKNGFVREAYFKDYFYFNGRFMDTAIYSLIGPA